MDDKHPLILWSGGLDSTYLCNEFASQRKPFDTLYVDGGQSQRKISAEWAARNWIRKQFEDLYGYKMATGRTVLSKVNLSNSPDVGFSQLLPWFVSAMESVDPDIHSEVMMGYVAGDQISSFMDRITEAWRLLWDVCKKQELVPLTFPLRLMRKQDILLKIPPSVYRLTWVCELPKLAEYGGQLPCGQCDACVSRGLEELRILKLHNTKLGPDKWTLKRLEEEENSQEKTDG